jgi:hypothetical protein
MTDALNVALAAWRRAASPGRGPVARAISVAAAHAAAMAALRAVAALALAAALRARDGVGAQRLQAVLDRGLAVDGVGSLRG